MIFGCFCDFGFECHVVVAESKVESEFSVFPLFFVAHETLPFAMLSLFENQLVVVGKVGFETKDFNQCACGFAKVQSCLYHFGVVANQQAVFRNKAGNVFEDMPAYFAFIINQQL